MTAGEKSNPVRSVSGRSTARIGWSGTSANCTHNCLRPPAYRGRNQELTA